MPKTLRITFLGNWLNWQPRKGFCFLHTVFADKQKLFWFHKHTDLRVENNCTTLALHVSHSFLFALVLSFMSNFLPMLSPLHHITVLVNLHSNLCSPHITHSIHHFCHQKGIWVTAKRVGKPPCQNTKVNFSFEHYSNSIVTFPLPSQNAAKRCHPKKWGQNPPKVIKITWIFVISSFWNLGLSVLW